MGFKSEDPNSIGLYMNDIGRHAMMVPDLETITGRRARLGYGLTVGVRGGRKRLLSAKAKIDADSALKVIRADLKALVNFGNKLYEERCDPEDISFDTWPDEDRWMHSAALAGFGRIRSLFDSLRVISATPGITLADIVKAIDDVLDAVAVVEAEHEGLLRTGAVAVDELVTANLRFVISVAKKYQGKGLSLSELTSAGNEGLIKAARKFDERVGTRFVSYSAFWIEQQIQKELDYSVGEIRPTGTQMVRNRRVWREIAESRREGREASVEALMERTGFTEARIREAMDTNISIASLDAPVDRTDAGSATYAQFIGSDDSLEDQEREREIRETVDRALNQLDPREAKILRLYFGIGGQEEWPLQDIGQALDICRERSRQLKERGLDHLANCAMTPALLEVAPIDAVDENSRYAKARAGATRKG